MTGCERILARLEEGPATAAELYATTYTVVHSRIADLRKRGHVIECEHVGGADASSYLYTLEDSAAGPNGALPSFPVEESQVAVVDAPSSTSAAEQLRLVA